MFRALQTPDGWLTAAHPPQDGVHRIEVAFQTEELFRSLVRGREGDLVFAARSRLARLGIDVAPAGELTWDGELLMLEVTVKAAVSTYGIEPLLGEILVPGLRVGRLVFCPAEGRLTSDQIDRLVLNNELQLPASFSIDHDGRFRIRPRGHVYDLIEPLTADSLLTIVARADGKDLLNRIQARRPVDRIVLPARDGVITSCSMFLHQHYVVLESEASPLGQHLEAVVLDPVTTRGTNVFLEFTNDTDHRIVNPSVAASVYEAVDVKPPPARWYGTDFTPPEAETVGPAARDYELLAEVFDRLESRSERRRYSHRLVAVVSSLEKLLNGTEPEAVWRSPPRPVSPVEGPDVTSRLQDDMPDYGGSLDYGTSLLADVSPGARVTLLLGYFPNLIEHSQICSAALEGKIRRIIFRRASFEHGPFLSSRDHGRLADYKGLGIDVFWCNDERKHVVTHVFRGLRGYFTEPENMERFQNALIFAAYGSSRPLPDDEVVKVERLLANLKAFFGPDIAILTGGGPGAMLQTTTIAQRHGVLAGASFIETVDQMTNETAEFYQTFQGRSRQARQRWFEVASFHLFFSGGVGTLEEVGLTLTDMKLGVIELSPLVFFGHHGEEPYWRGLAGQFDIMTDAKRGPPWLESHTLMTDDPDAVPAFYKRILELG